MAGNLHQITLPSLELLHEHVSLVQICPVTCRRIVTLYKIVDVGRRVYQQTCLLQFVHGQKTVNGVVGPGNSAMLL